MRVELDEDGRTITLQAPTTAAPTVRQIPGARHISKRQVWLLPLSWSSCVTARGVIGERLEIGPQLAEWARVQLANRIVPALTFRDATDADGRMASGLDEIENWAASEGRVLDGSPRRLYTYQRPVAAFLAVAGSALLGDDMGVGKTPPTIRALQLLSRENYVFPALIVVPNGVKRQWVKRFGEWWPEARVMAAPSGTASARKAVAAIGAGEAEILVINYEALPNLSRLAPYGSIALKGCVNCDPLVADRARLWDEARARGEYPSKIVKRKGVDERVEIRVRPGNPSRCHREPKELNRIPWQTVIADEVHRASEPTAIQTRALWSIGDRAVYRFGLTGTPPEDPGKLWCVMRFVAPEEYPVKGSGPPEPKGFIGRYATTQSNIWSGFSEAVGFNPERREEFDKFFLPRFMRRPYEIVPEQQEPIRERRDVELTGKQLKAYKDFKRSLLAEVDSGLIWTSNPLEKVLRLRQLASAYGEADGSGGMVLAEPSSKLDELDEVLEELGDRQAIIFAESRQLIQLLAARMEKQEWKFGRLVGGVSEEDRGLAVEMFGKGDLRYILATTGTSAEGIDGLQCASVGIFLQRSRYSVHNVQAEGRIKRSGQKHAPLFIDLVTVGTVEEDILKDMRDKAARLEDLVHDADTLRRWLS